MMTIEDLNNSGENLSSTEKTLHINAFEYGDLNSTDDPTSFFYSNDNKILSNGGTDQGTYISGMDNSGSFSSSDVYYKIHTKSLTVTASSSNSSNTITASDNSFDNSEYLPIKFTSGSFPLGTTEGLKRFKSTDIFFIRNPNTAGAPPASISTFNISYSVSESSISNDDSIFQNTSNITVQSAGPRNYLYLTRDTSMSSSSSKTYSAGKIIITLFGSATF